MLRWVTLWGEWKGHGKQGMAKRDEEQGLANVDWRTADGEHGLTNMKKGIKNMGWWTSNDERGMINVEWRTGDGVRKRGLTNVEKWMKNMGWWTLNDEHGMKNVEWRTGDGERCTNNKLQHCKYTGEDLQWGCCRAHASAMYWRKPSQGHLSGGRGKAWHCS